MLKWLKKKIKRWLQDNDPEIIWTNRLDCHAPVQGDPPRTYLIDGVIGMRLRGTDLVTGGIRLVGQDESLDPAEWACLWRRHGGDQGWRWPDGTPFTPGS